MNVFALLCCLACQDPAPVPGSIPPPPRALDVLELKNGDELQGHITTEIDGYVEIQLEVGAVVGISRAQIAAIRRGAGGAPAPTAPLPSTNEWFVLHDAQGSAVGWLHTSSSPTAAGGLSIHEEYEFVEGQRRYQVTSLATTDARLQPVGCYFRERISEPMLASLALSNFDTSGQHDRIADERIVEAKCEAGRLLVQRLDRSGRRERELPWTDGSSFPLLARLRARHDGRPTGTLSLFDPATEEMVQRSYDGSRQRAVVVDGKRARVTEVAEHSATGSNREWVDATARTVRRELAGPALVAVPSSADSAAKAVGAVTIASAIAAEAGGTFGLWVPNPAWVVRDGSPAGQIVLGCEAHGASVALTRLDHLETATMLEVAVDAVAKWFQLLHPELEPAGREPVRVRDRAGIRLSARGRRSGASWRATVDVIPHRGRFLALVCIAPEAAWDELAADFAFLQRSVELEEQALAPKLQGPLAERPATPRANAPASTPATTPSPAKPPARKATNDTSVRIPGAV